MSGSESIEGGNGKVRGSEEDDAQRRSIVDRPERRQCVDVTTVDVVCVVGLLEAAGPRSGLALVVAPGAWSRMVPVGARGSVGLPPIFLPSAPLLVSAPAPGMPFAVGDCAELVTGCVIPGGEFW